MFIVTGSKSILIPCFSTLGFNPKTPSCTEGSVSKKWGIEAMNGAFKHFLTSIKPFLGQVDGVSQKQCNLGSLAKSPKFAIYLFAAMPPYDDFFSYQAPKDLKIYHIFYFFEYNISFYYDLPAYFRTV